MKQSSTIDVVPTQEDVAIQNRSVSRGTNYVFRNMVNGDYVDYRQMSRIAKGQRSVDGHGPIESRHEAWLNS